MEAPEKSLEEPLNPEAIEVPQQSPKVTEKSLNMLKKSIDMPKEPLDVLQKSLLVPQRRLEALWWLFEVPKTSVLST